MGKARLLALPQSNGQCKWAGPYRVSPMRTYPKHRAHPQNDCIEAQSLLIVYRKNLYGARALSLRRASTSFNQETDRTP